MALQKKGTRSTAAERRQRESLGALGEDAATRRRGKNWVFIPDGGSVIMRVLPETFKEVHVHRTPIDVEVDGAKGRKKVVTKHYDVPCLDQEEDGEPCPGCSDDLERRYKFYVWVILRGDPDADEAAGKKDRLALWSGGVKLFKSLNKKHKAKGLENRDIEVGRQGERFDTEYEVDWFDDSNTPLSAADKKLAAKVEALDFYTTPPEFDEFYEPPSSRAKGRDDDEDDDVGERSRRRGSPFNGEKKVSGASSKSSGASGLAALRKNKGSGDVKKSAGTKKVIKKRRG